jgi:MFS family permease
MTVAALGSAYAPDVYTLMIFRFIVGIGVFSIFLVGVMAVIPWFGMQNMKSLLPIFSYVGIATLSIAFMAVLMFWGSIGAAFGYQLAQVYTFVPIFGISALLVAGLAKEAK